MLRGKTTSYWEFRNKHTFLQSDKIRLITHGIDFDFAPEDPIDTDRICKNERHSHESDDQHDPKGFLGGGGIVDIQTIGGIRIGFDQIGEYTQAE